MPNWKKVIVSGSDAALNSLNVTTSLTASGLIYPNTDGIDGQVLKTDGLGNLFFENTTTTTISIKNVSGGTIIKGTPCYITGSGTSGNVAGVWPADASDSLKMPAGVIAGETLNDGDEGIGLLNGFINGVDTSAFNAGDSVYVAAGGGYTNIRPTGSTIFVQKLGNVEKVDASNGSGVINGPSYYNDLPNVQQGYTWVGNSNGVAIATATSSIQNVVSSSFASTVGSLSSNITNNTDNRVLTATGGGSINGEANLTFNGSKLIVTSSVEATSFTGSFNIPDNGTLGIGQQTFYPQGDDGFSVNEDFNVGNANQTAYHFTSGDVNRTSVVFSLARTTQFTNMFGVTGSSSNNKFVFGAEFGNTDFEWRKSLGVTPVQLQGGTLLASLSRDGNFYTLGGFTGSLQGTSSYATQALSSSYALTASYINGSVVAPGSDTQIAFNNAGVLDANSGFVYSGSNVGIGTSSPEYKLSVAGKLSLGDGVDSLFIGVNAGKNDDGTSNGNIAIGPAALTSNVVGTNNIAIGSGSQNVNLASNNTSVGINTLPFNTTGANNTAIGSYSQWKTTTGTFNTSVGTNTLYTNTVGTLNVAVGSSALGLSTSGSSNVGIGTSALFNNVTGSENIGIGRNAGRYYSTGTSANTNTSASIFIGFNSRANAPGETNQIVIGNETLGLGSNTVVLGNNNIVTTALKGNVGIGITNPTYKLDVSGSGNYTNDLTVTGSLIVTGGITGSLLGTASYASQALSSSYAVTASYAQTAGSTAAVAGTTNYVSKFTSGTTIGNSQIFDNGTNVGIGTTTPLYTLDVSGSTRISGETNTSISSSLVVYGSGSTQPVFTVQGSQGELFSVTDSLSGSLFSVNDISGLPILEVFSDNTILMGSYQAPSLNTTAKVVTTASGTFTIYSIPTSSYDGAFFEYVAKSGSNARAGQISAVWSGTSVNYTETTTTNFGTTSGLTLGVFIVGSNIALTGSGTTLGWTIKTIVRSI